MDDLKADFAKLNKQLEKAEKKHGGKSLEELRTMMLSTAKKVEQKKEELRICAHTHSDVKSSFQTRYRHWCKEVKIKGKQSASDFNTRLSRKQHAGTLNFNHDEEKLSLEARAPRTAPSLCPPLPPPPPPTALAACSLRRWRATRRTRRPRPRPTRAA